LGVYLQVYVKGSGLSEGELSQKQRLAEAFWITIPRPEYCHRKWRPVRWHLQWTSILCFCSSWLGQTLCLASRRYDKDMSIDW